MNVSTADLAAILKITARRVGQLTDEGKIPKAARNLYALEDAIPAYVAFRVSEASEEAGDLEKARIRQTNAKADQEEIKAARLKGTVHDGGVIEKIWADMIMTAKTRILSIPTKAAGRVQSILPLPQVEAILREPCVEALNELAAYDPSKLVEEFFAAQQVADDQETEADPAAQ